MIKRKLKLDAIITIIAITILCTFVRGINNQVKATSSDTTLKSITVSPNGSGLEQDEENNKIYRVKVDNNITSIIVNATPNDSNAKVSVAGNEILQVGTNRVNITVTAEDGTIDTYTIYVRRSDIPISSGEIVPNVQNPTTEENNTEKEENIINDVMENEETNSTTENNANEETNIQATNSENIQSDTNTNKNNNTIIFICIGIIVIAIIILIIVKRK